MDNTYRWDSVKVQYVKTNIGRNVKIFMTSTLLLLMLFLVSGTTTNTEYIDETIPPDALEKEVILVTDRADIFTPDKLRDLLIDLNLRHPDIIYAQALIESGHFTSDIFIENHNLFGMKVATQRPTTNKGVRRNHAYYSSWQNSVLDYAMYQSKYLSKLSKEQYLSYLHRSYAEDKTYVARIRDIISKDETCIYLQSI